MRGFKSIFVSSKHKINCFLIQEKCFQTANAVDTLPLTPEATKRIGIRYPFLNIDYNFKLAQDTDTTLSVPYPTPI